MSPTPNLPERGLILGIDYGTSTTLISWARLGQTDPPPPKLLEIGRTLDAGAVGEDRLLAPSTLAWSRVASEREVRIGRHAEASAPMEYLILRSLKRCLRCTHDKATGEGTCFNEQNRALCAGRGRYNLGGLLYNTHELIEIYLDRMLQELRDSEDLPVSLDEARHIRLGVPGDFSRTLREVAASALGGVVIGRSRRAASLAILEEPTAALRYLYAYLLAEPEPGLHVVVDIGGGTTDIAIFSYTGSRGGPETHPATAVPIAGDDFDEVLFQRYRNKLDRPSEYEVRAFLRSVKHALGSGREVRGFPTAELLKTLRPVAARICDHVFREIHKVREAFELVGFSHRPHVVRIYLVGGGSRLRLIDQVLKDHPQYEEFGAPDILRLPQLWEGGITEVQVVALGLSIERSVIDPVSPQWLPCTVRFVAYKSMQDTRGQEIGRLERGSPLPSRWVELTLTRNTAENLFLHHDWQDQAGELLGESLLGHETADQWLRQVVHESSAPVHFQFNGYGELVIHVGPDPNNRLPRDRRGRFALPWRGQFTQQWRRQEINRLRKEMGLDPLF